MLFWAQFAQKSVHYGPRLEWNTILGGRNNKSRLSAFRNFLFYQNIVSFGWVIGLFLPWVKFFVKKVSFPAKTGNYPLILNKQWRIRLVSRKFGLFFNFFFEIKHSTNKPGTVFVLRKPDWVIYMILVNVSAYLEQLDVNKVSSFDSCYSKLKFYFLIKIEIAS